MQLTLFDFGMRDFAKNGQELDGSAACLSELEKILITVGKYGNVTRIEIGMSESVGVYIYMRIKFFPNMN